MNFLQDNRDVYSNCSIDVLYNSNFHETTCLILVFILKILYARIISSATNSKNLIIEMTCKGVLSLSIILM
eukprot:c37989_g1_i1 orf=152-364(+)